MIPDDEKIRKAVEAIKNDIETFAMLDTDENEWALNSLLDLATAYLAVTGEPKQLYPGMLLANVDITSNEYDKCIKWFNKACTQWKLYHLKVVWEKDKEITRLCLLTDSIGNVEFSSTSDLDDKDAKIADLQQENEQLQKQVQERLNYELMRDKVIVKLGTERDELRKKLESGGGKQ